METVISQTLSVYLLIAAISIAVLTLVAGRALLRYRKHVATSRSPLTRHATTIPEPLRRELAGVFCRLRNPDSTPEQAGTVRTAFLFFALTLVAGLTFLVFVLHQLALILP